MYVKLGGEMVYLRRAVAHEDEILERYVASSRDKDAAQKAPKCHGSPEVIIAGLRSYCAAMKELGSAEKQEMGRWTNNRGKNNHPPFRRREWAISAVH